MADSQEQSSNVDSTPTAAIEKLSELPASMSSDGAVEHAPPGRYRLFNRQRPLHKIIGGGKGNLKYFMIASYSVCMLLFEDWPFTIAADVVLWKRRSISIGVLIAATAVWLLFERSGYTLLSLVSNVLLLLIAILFLWANAAALLNRSPPPLPELELSEEMVNSSAASILSKINSALAMAHDIALGKDFKLFLKVVVCLWLLSIVGGWFNFLTLVYISILASFTIPALYNKYEDHVDRYAEILEKVFRKHYKKFDEKVISKVARVFLKEKKMQ
eukprot:Gb_40791 [translate_table: standard]